MNNEWKINENQKCIKITQIQVSSLEPSETHFINLKKFYRQPNRESDKHIYKMIIGRYINWKRNQGTTNIELSSLKAGSSFVIL